MYFTIGVYAVLKYLDFYVTFVLVRDVTNEKCLDKSGYIYTGKKLLSLLSSLLLLLLMTKSFLLLLLLCGGGFVVGFCGCFSCVALKLDTK